MSDLVGNPEDRFSRVEAQMSSYETYYIKEETNYTSRLLPLLQEYLEKMSVHQLKQYLQSY